MLLWAAGNHIDHRITRQAALETLACADLPLAFYEDLPYTAQAWHTDRLAEYLAATNLALEPAFAAPVSEDAPRQIQRKLRMAECYDSQVDSEEVRSIAEFAGTYSGRERLWGNSVWHRSALSVR